MKTRIKLSMMVVMFMTITGCSIGALKSDIQPQQDNTSYISTEDTSNRVILNWNEQALDTVREGKLDAAVAGRIYAMVNAAMYDAVNGIDVARGLSKRDYAIVAPHNARKLFIAPYHAPKNGNRPAAAAAAAHTVLSALHPENKEIYNTQINADLADLGNTQWVVNGQKLG